jgi:NAD+ synthase
MFHADKTRDLLVEWMREKVESAKANGVIYGLSGGIDSAVIAGLAQLAFPNSSLGIIMPCHSDPKDKEDALLVAEALKIKTREIDLAPAFDYLTQTTGEEPKTMGAHNLKPRLRVATLNLIGQNLGYLVLGSSNASEWYTGYFTKFGDSAADLIPLGHLVKAEVWELGKLLGVPEKIITKAPTAGLWAGQTDESELGISYKDIDNFLLYRTGDPKAIERIEQLNKRSTHKRQMPPMGPVIRD